MTRVAWPIGGQRRVVFRAGRAVKDNLAGDHSGGRGRDPGTCELKADLESGRQESPLNLRATALLPGRSVAVPRSRYSGIESKGRIRPVPASVPCSIVPRQVTAALPFWKSARSPRR